MTCGEVNVDMIREDGAQAREAVQAPALTGRQSEVLELIARGLSDREIAVSLGISPRTVRMHADVLRMKLGVARRRELPYAYLCLHADAELSAASVSYCATGYGRLGAAYALRAVDGLFARRRAGSLRVAGVSRITRDSGDKRSDSRFGDEVPALSGRGAGHRDRAER